jgi:hypothetical protein
MAIFSNRVHHIKWKGDKWLGKDLEGSGHGLVLRYHPGIHLEELRKTTKNLSQNIRSLGRDLNPGPPHKAGVSHLTMMFGF